MNSAVLDTDILSEYMRGKNANIARSAAAYLAEHYVFAVTTITVFEVMSGYYRAGQPPHLGPFVDFLEQISTFACTADIARLSGEIHGRLAQQGFGIGLPDTIIAATALHHSLNLVTGNTEHYRRIQELGYDLKLENWRD